MRTRLLMSAAVASLVAGCANQPAPSQTTAANTPPPASPAAGAATPAGGLDGVYRGRASGNSRCGPTMFGHPIRVQNGVAAIQTNTAGGISGPVGPDGSLMVEHGRQTLQGKFSGNEFHGSISFGACAYTLDYTKR